MIWMLSAQPKSVVIKYEKDEKWEILITNKHKLVSHPWKNVLELFSFRLAVFDTDS